MPEEPHAEPRATIVRQVGPGPDAHGQAAMLLVESLLHALIARSTLTVAEALEVVEVAADAKREIADDLGESPESLKRSLTILDGIARTLEHDRERR